MEPITESLIQRIARKVFNSMFPSMIKNSNVITNNIGYDKVLGIIQNGNQFNFFDDANPSQNQAIYINYKGHNGGNTGEAITDIYICNGQGGQTGVKLHVEKMTLNGTIDGVSDITLNGNSLVTTLQNLADSISNLSTAISNLGISDISGLSAVLQDFEDRIYALEHPTP